MTARFIPDPDILWWYDGPLHGLCTLDGVTHFYADVTYLNGDDGPVMNVVLSLLPGEEQVIRARYAGSSVRIHAGSSQIVAWATATDMGVRLSSDRIVAWVTGTDGEQQVDAAPPAHVSRADIEDLTWEFERDKEKS